MTNPVPYTIRQLPVVGRWASRIGRTIDIWGHPCNTEPEVWVRAAWQTVPYMLIALIKPSGVEAGRARFGRGHGKTPKFKLTSLVEIPGMAHPIPGAFTWALFRLTGVGAAILQYVQFADIATGGLLQWSSLVYQYSGCQVPGGGAGSQHVSAPTFVLGSFTGTYLLVTTSVTQQDRCVGSAFTWACDASQTWGAGFSVTWENVPGFPPANATFELDDGAGNTILTEGWDKTNSDGSFTTMRFYRNINPVFNPSNFKVRFTANFTFLVTGGFFTVAGGPKQNFLRPDP